MKCLVWLLCLVSVNCFAADYSLNCNEGVHTTIVSYNVVNSNTIEYTDVNGKMHLVQGLICTIEEN